MWPPLSFLNNHSNNLGEVRLFALVYRQTGSVTGNLHHEVTLMSLAKRILIICKLLESKSVHFFLLRGKIPSHINLRNQAAF